MPQARMLHDQDPVLADLIHQEEVRQAQGLELIASENYVSGAVLEALGSVLTNKYAEGYAGQRYYAGNAVIDKVEELAIARAKELFQAEHVNVQPYSGSPANLAAYLAFLTPGETILGLRIDQGGHLTHGLRVNFSGKLFAFVPYELDPTTEQIDLEGLRILAREHRPKLIVAGFSAYPRDIPWAEIQSIAKEVGAYTMADIAHTAGLVAGKALPNPVPLVDVVTMTTHKTLRGPRGAIICTKAEFAHQVDRAVFPGIQGGPHEHVIAAKAVAFGEALRPTFPTYANAVIENAKQLAEDVLSAGFRLVSGGTDTHLLLIDTVTSVGLTGQEAEDALEAIGLSTNKNMIPFDSRKPNDPSGIRIGTAAVTTRGMGKAEMTKLAKLIIHCLKKEAAPAALLVEVKQLAKDFPIKEIL